MGLRVALALAYAATSAAFNCSGGVHTLSVNEATGSYDVLVAGAAWFVNGSVAVHQGGVWYSTANNSLVLAATAASSGDDTLLGPFHAFTLNYTASALRVAATFRCYAAGVLVFELAFEDGALNVNTEFPGDVPSGGGEFNASSAPSSHFPSFAVAPLQAPDIGFLEWNGRFTNDNDAFGVGLRGFTGGATGGPLTLFAVNASALPPAPTPPATVVLGAFDNFKSTMLARVPEPGAPPPSPTCSDVTHGVDQVGGSGCTAAGLNVSDQAACCAACASDPCCETWVYDPVNLMPPAPGENCWPLRGVVATTPSPNRTVGVTRGASGRLVAGVQGYAVNLAPGYTHKVALVSSAAGITDAVLRYGAGLQAAYGTAAGRPPPSEDVLSHKLSYWTDNGAYYDCSWWGAWAPGKPTANDVLRNLSAWHAQAGFPFASYQVGALPVTQWTVCVVQFLPSSRPLWRAARPLVVRRHRPARRLRPADELERRPSHLARRPARDGPPAHALLVLLRARRRGQRDDGVRVVRLGLHQRRLVRRQDLAGVCREGEMGGGAVRPRQRPP